MKNKYKFTDLYILNKNNIKYQIKNDNTIKVNDFIIQYLDDKLIYTYKKIKFEDSIVHYSNIIKKIDFFNIIIELYKKCNKLILIELLLLKMSKFEADNKITFYGKIQKLYGNKRFEILCSDGITRTGILLKSAAKKYKIEKDDIVVVKIFDFDTKNDKCQIIYKLNKKEEKELLKNDSKLFTKCDIIEFIHTTENEKNSSTDDEFIVDTISEYYIE